MNNPEKSTDFDINKLNYNEDREVNKNKLELTINNTSDFEKLKKNISRPEKKNI